MIETTAGRETGATKKQAEPALVASPVLCVFILNETDGAQVAPPPRMTISTRRLSFFVPLGLAEPNAAE